MGFWVIINFENSHLEMLLTHVGKALLPYGYLILQAISNH